MDVLLFLFCDFLLYLNSFLLFFLTFLLFRSFLSLFLLFFHIFLHCLLHLTVVSLSFPFFLDDFAYFPFMFFLCQDVRNGFLRLFIHQLLVKVRNQFQMLNPSCFFFVHLHLLWCNLHWILWGWGFDKSRQICCLLFHSDFALNDTCKYWLVYMRCINPTVYSFKLWTKKLLDS